MSDIGNKEIFAENLNRYMELSGKSRADVCNALDLRYSTFSDWCQAKKYPRIDKIELLADYFGVMKSDLIERQVRDAKKEPANDDGLSKTKSDLISIVENMSESEAAVLLASLRSALERL